MINIKKIFSVGVIIIALSLIVLGNTPVLAVKKAVFQNGKSLQPLPGDAFPNISGNVNSTTSVAPSQTQIDNNVAGSTSNSNQGNNDSKGSSHSLWWWLMIPLVVIIFIFTYLKLKKDSRVN